MTNSYYLSPKIRIVFFHGMNNNAGSFRPLMEHFKQLGHETELVILPGHGKERKEAQNFADACRIFEKSMEALEKTPYVAVAFSQGALFLQLWLETHQENRPIKQILLAPALYVKRQFLIEIATRLLPSFFLIKSFSPKPFQLFSSLFVWEYKLIIEGVLNYQKTRTAFDLPTLIAIDPKDELVDARTLKNEIEKLNPQQKVEFINREKLKKEIGFHHLLFHPEYFDKQDWDQFTKKLLDFLVSG